MATKFTPLHDRILVRRVEEVGTTRGGIIIPDSAKDKPQEGEIISVGRARATKKARPSPSQSKRATTFCSANTPAPKSSSMVKISSSCAKKKSWASSPARPKKNGIASIVV